MTAYHLYAEMSWSICHMHYKYFLSYNHGLLFFASGGNFLKENIMVMFHSLVNRFFFSATGLKRFADNFLVSSSESKWYFKMSLYFPVDCWLLQ